MNANIIFKCDKYLTTYKSLQIICLDFEKRSYIDFSSVCAQMRMSSPSAVIQLC